MATVISSSSSSTAEIFGSSAGGKSRVFFPFSLHRERKQEDARAGKVISSNWALHMRGLSSQTHQQGLGHMDNYLAGSLRLSIPRVGACWWTQASAGEEGGLH